MLAAVRRFRIARDDLAPWVQLRNALAYCIMAAAYGDFSQSLGS